MMLQTSGCQSYGLRAALLAGAYTARPAHDISRVSGSTYCSGTHDACRRGSGRPAPRAIRFWFNEPVERHFSRIEVFRASWTPGLVRCSLGSALTKVGCRGLAPRARCASSETLAPGRYIVQWMVLAIDAHRTQGSFMFTYDPSSAT